MTDWNLKIADETDRSVRRYLAQSGQDEAGLSQFVDEAVRAEVLRRTVRAIQERNSDLSPDDAQALADEAVAWTRANPA